jgi:hypothetical protein
MGQKKHAYRLLVGNTEENKALRRPKHRWWIILRWIFKR